MTSNVGTQWISEPGAQDDEKMRNKVLEAMRQRFRPEFLNRVDEIMIFNRLSREQLAEIVDIQVGHLEELLSAKNIQLEISPEARAALAEEGYDPVYGARPLKRTIQRRIQNPLAMCLLRGEFGEGDVLQVDFANGDYVFTRARVEEQVPA